MLHLKRSLGGESWIPGVDGRLRVVEVDDGRPTEVLTGVFRLAGHLGPPGLHNFHPTWRVVGPHNANRGISGAKPGLTRLELKRRQTVFNRIAHAAALPAVRVC